MNQRLDAGRLLIALGALVLLIGLFSDWYGSPGGFEGAQVSAWTAFEIVDLLLAALALAALAALARDVAPAARIPALPRLLPAAAGAAAFVLVAASLIDEPPAVMGASLEAGAWVSFAGASLMALGAILSNARISLVVSARETAPPRNPPGSTRSAEHPPSHPAAETQTMPPQ